MEERAEDFVADDAFAPPFGKRLDVKDLSPFIQWYCLVWRVRLTVGVRALQMDHSRNEILIFVRCAFCSLGHRYLYLVLRSICNNVVYD